MTENSGPEYWLKKLGGVSLPIFSQTVREVSGVVTDNTTSARDLARAIGQDASLTARLLKIANSPLFNPGHQPSESINTAVVRLGFETVRELAVSLSLVEQVLKGKQHTRVTQGMARAFHAAAQARSFAVHMQDERPEEVFVAALLLKIGEVAFWSVAETESAAMERLTRAGASLAEAEQRVLGFPLNTLTARLVETWQLGTLLEQVVSGKEESARATNVALGHRIALTAEQFGLASPEFRELLLEVAATLDLGVDETRSLIEENLKEAGKIASRYGVPRVEDYLCDQEATVGSEATPLLSQLECLQNISELLATGPGLDELALLVLRGIREGVGFDRTYLALITPDRKALELKHLLGEDIDCGQLDLTGSNLFQMLFETGKSLLVTDQQRSTLAPLLSTGIRRWVSVSPFAVMPLLVDNKPVGLIYADNDASGRPIDEEAFSGFRHFGQQLTLGLNMMRHG